MSQIKKLKSSDFVHLHNHTEYSVLDGLTKIKPLIENIKNNGMTAIAKTDHGTLSGSIEFYKEAKSQGIKPIIGLEAYVATRKHTDKDPAKDKNRYHLILLAMNDKGYKNLMQLSTIANLDGFYYYPRIDHDLIEKHNDGLVCLSGCLSGEVGDALNQNQYDKAKQIASWYKSIFGERYYLEVQDHGHPDNPLFNKDQEKVNSNIFQLSADLDIPVVLTCDAHYLEKKDQEAHEILLCVGTGTYLDETGRLTLKDYPLHVESSKEIIDRWGKNHPEVIENTIKVANKCDLKIELGRILIPKFEVPRGESEKTLLYTSVYQGLAWRYGGIDREKSLLLTLSEAKSKLRKEIVDRADYELSVIEKMGFSGYFLIISDFVNWGKEKGIVFGPGRGSAAGSIIAYSLRITELDPLHYDLLFERFLNPERISMPDIDIDIQDTRRDEVIQYCVDKYGRNRVANIVTFGRMFARNAVRDVARVLRVPYADADRLAKLIPMPVQGRHIPLATSLKEDVDLLNEYKTNEESRRVLDLAVILEGTVRNHGVHAAGIVIAPEDIVNYAPLEMAQKGVIATQYPMVPIEELGLLKMDLLGLSNLTIIKNALRIIKKVYGKDIDINLIPLDDKKTIELFRRGDTTGVFQFESAGMKRYLKELKPTVFEDIIAMGALYRPGPMQWIDDFIARKNGKKKIEFIHPSMEPAIKNTYGIIVYQEQVMQISIDMCGFTGGQADKLRKAIGKKQPQELAKMKSDFIEGAVKTVKADRQLLEKFWVQLEDFAAYCFNKSHAACYALISYQTAYLKAHYPEAFMSALMTSDYNNIDRLAIEITECKRMGIDVLPPDINESFLEFGIIPGKNKIRFGLLAIKNVGTNAVEAIISVREKGQFQSLEDFFSRVDTTIVNRKSLESLIKSGAFDNYGDRNYLLINLDNLLAYSARLKKDAKTGQTDLFGNSIGSESMKVKLTLIETTDKTSDKIKLNWERELLGLYLSKHPLDNVKEFLEKNTIPLTLLDNSYDDKKITIGGVISDLRAITTRNGQKMAFVKIEDATSEIDTIFFPQTYQANFSNIERDNIVILSGQYSLGRNKTDTLDPKIIVDSMELITPELIKSYEVSTDILSKKVTLKTDTNLNLSSQRLFIRLANSNNEELLLSLKQTIDNYNGETDVILVLGPNESKQIIKLPMKIKTNKSSIKELRQLVGAENIKLY